MAAAAFLPSSIAMLQVCLVWALWLSDRAYTAIFVGACTCIVVWPFTGLLFVPLGLHALWVSPWRAILVAVGSFAFWAALSFLVDSSFYGRPLLPVWEIIRYNVLDRGKKGGPELYGVEPWYFYLNNGVLNLTLALPAAAALPAVSVLCSFIARVTKKDSDNRHVSVLGFALAGYIWVVFFSTIPHKEERFLAPAYPVLLFAAAAAAHITTTRLLPVIAALVVGPSIARSLRHLHVLFVLATCVVSASRIVALQTGYAAPVSIYGALHKHLQVLRASKGAGPIHVCVGGEWHRFMTSFFLPHHDDHLSYVRFGPTGLLPVEFNTTLGTSGVPPHMNDLNKEEPSRYVDPNVCSMFVDLDIEGLSGEGDIPGLRRRAEEAGLLAESPFLDASKSRFPWRAFYVPAVSTKRNVYARYKLLSLSNLR